MITKIGLLAVLAFAATPALAGAGSTFGITLSGDAERRIVSYDCGTEQPLTVEYLNAAPNFLALIPIGGEALVFVSVLTASGARYESGQFIWWSKGADATLHDVTEGLDAAPVLSCSENIETP